MIRETTPKVGAGDLPKAWYARVTKCLAEKRWTQKAARQVLQCANELEAALAQHALAANEAKPTVGPGQREMENGLADVALGLEEILKSATLVGIRGPLLSCIERIREIAAAQRQPALGGLIIPPKRWEQINAERGRLIDKNIARTISETEALYLEALNAYADQHLAELERAAAVPAEQAGPAPGALPCVWRTGCPAAEKCMGEGYCLQVPARESSEPPAGAVAPPLANQITAIRNLFADKGNAGAEPPTAQEIIAILRAVAPPETVQAASPRVAAPLEFDLASAKALLDMFGGADTLVSVTRHEGKLIAYATEYPEEGSIVLGGGGDGK